MWSQISNFIKQNVVSTVNNFAINEGARKKPKASLISSHVVEIINDNFGSVSSLCFISRK